MGALKNTLLIGLILLLAASCSVMSRQIRTEAEPSVGYRTLVKEVDKYIGKTFILGGYVLETENLGDQTTVVILQAPLGLRDEPKSKDDTEGRFIVSYRGWLDPLVYIKNRRITVAGVVVSRSTTGKYTFGPSIIMRPGTSGLDIPITHFLTTHIPIIHMIGITIPGFDTPGLCHLGIHIPGFHIQGIGDLYINLRPSSNCRTPCLDI